MWYWVLLWIFSLIAIAGLIFFTVYLVAIIFLALMQALTNSSQLVSLADLESTDMNPIDMCRQLNILIVPGESQSLGAKTCSDFPVLFIFFS
jgi:hypothetical protein